VINREINITLRIQLATGKVTLNEIVYQLKEFRDPLMGEILKEILTDYDELIHDRLSQPHPTRMRKGLGRHVQKGHPEKAYCRGRRTQKKGVRQKSRQFSTTFGKVKFPLRIAKCRCCGAQYSPLLGALKVEAYSHKESNLEREITEAVIDTNYRRLIDHHSIDISLGGIHNVIVGSDLDALDQEKIDLADLSGLMADGTGLKGYQGKRGELRVVLGLTRKGRLTPLGCFTNTSWGDIEKVIRKRLKKQKESQPLPFVYDGEPGLDTFLADIANTQRCTWHASRGLYHALWEDGIKKKESLPFSKDLRQLVGIEVPSEAYQLLQEKDKEPVKAQYDTSKKEIQALIQVFREKGYHHAVEYLENLSRRVFTHVELWLETGVIAPKTISLLERVFREIGRRIKRIAWGWSDRVATKLSKMILIRQYSRDRWEQFWKKKLVIEGHLKIKLQSIHIVPCQTF